MLETFADNLTHSLCRYAGQSAENASSELRALILQLVTAEHSGQDAVFMDANTLNALQRDYPTLLGDFQSDTPLVVFGEQICTRRHYQNAIRVASFFDTQSNIATISQQVFVDVDAELDIWQKVAVFACVYNRVTLITGGAGTGKTTTLKHAVHALRCAQSEMKIALSAPTGKAVKRIQQAFASESGMTMKTLHQLLGIKEETATPYFHAQRQLDCDVLVIDEASMVGHALFSLVIDALPKHAKLIMLGDDNQLPPVNAVPIFHPIVHQSFGFDDTFCSQFERVFGESVPVLDTSEPALMNHHVKLHKTFRFGDAIFDLANAVLANDTDALLQHENVRFSEDITASVLTDIDSRIEEGRLREQLLNDELPTVLCAMRSGTASTEVINAKLDQQFRSLLGVSDTWYVGRKIIVEKNDYDLGVFNGDVGVCVERDGRHVIEFEQGRILAIDQLPIYSLAFAITVHKSQGSEYDEVLIAFTAYSDGSDLLTQDLLYTAITRAKKKVTIYTQMTHLTHLTTCRINASCLDNVLRKRSFVRRS